MTNSWFLIRFSCPEACNAVFAHRPWFVQGLNFVLLPWRPFFNPFISSISAVDQWVKIPFLPNEYWSVEFLPSICANVGSFIRLDKFTLDNETSKLFMSYEGVYEACLICGSKDHTLNSCPAKPPRMELVVAKLEASHIDSSGATGDDWATIFPRRRGKPRVASKHSKARPPFHPYPPGD